MNSRINLTPEQAKLHANTIEAISEDIRNVNATLKSMSDVTLAPWQGNAKHAFTTAFEEFYPKLQDAAAILREISMNLNATARVVEQVDGRTN